MADALAPLVALFARVELARRLGTAPRTRRKRKRNLIASVGVAGLMLAGATGPALAHKPDKPSNAERMCEGGTFISVDDLVYACLFPTAASEKEIKAAACECKQGSALFVGVGNLAYVCVLPGGDILNLPGGGPDPVTGHLLLGGMRLLPVVIR